MALSFFGAFVIVYSELKNDFMRRLELGFGGFDCEFGEPSPLPLLLNRVTTCFNNLV